MDGSVIKRSRRCLMCKIRLQRIIEEMISCVNEAKEYERDIFDLYIAKCYSVYGGYVTTLYSLFSFVIRFATITLPVNFILYLHHTAICCQGVGHFCMCVFAALLMWFTVARFDCLTIEFERTTNVRTLITCVKKQLHLKR